MGRARPTSRSLCTEAGRRKFIVRSEVVRTFPDGSPVDTAPPSGASARKAITPGVNTPAEVCHQGDAGMPYTTLSGLLSTGRSPVKWWIGGAGITPVAPTRMRSRPDSPRNPMSAYPPRTGSRQTSLGSLIGPNSKRSV